MDVIYTCYPYEMAKEDQAVAYYTYQGVKVCAEHIQGDCYRVISICSTEPKDFLRRDLYPGSRIYLKH